LTEIIVSRLKGVRENDGAAGTQQMFNSSKSGDHDNPIRCTGSNDPWRGAAPPSDGFIAIT
jgi:hypothetical protein